MVATVVTIGLVLAVAYLSTLFKASRVGSQALRIREDREQMLAVRARSRDHDGGTAGRNLTHG